MGKTTKKHRTSPDVQFKEFSREQQTTIQKWKFDSNKRLGLECTINELGKLFRKKSDPKN